MKPALLVVGMDYAPASCLFEACPEAVEDGKCGPRWYETITPLQRQLFGRSVLSIPNARALGDLQSMALTYKVSIFVTSAGDLVGNYIRELAHIRGMTEEEIRRTSWS